MLNRTRKAFTMLELIVVIVILGILALIAIPTFAQVIEKTRLSSLQRTGESLGREAVALAAFEDRDLAVADVTAATVTADNTATTGVDETKAVFDINKTDAAGRVVTVTIVHNVVTSAKKA